DIINSEIYITPPDDPMKISKIIYENGGWKIFGTSNKYNLTFILNEDYTKLTDLPPDMIREIGLELSLNDLFNLCRVNKKLNKFLCDDEIYWRLRYERDFGRASPHPKSWKELYKTEGIVWVSGHNESGQLGLGKFTQNIVNTPIQIPSIKAKAVACGSSHSMIIDTSANVWAFGNNDHGQLGLGDLLCRNKPTQILNVKAKTISCGQEHTIIIDTTASLWSFGHNIDGQLGLGDNNDRCTPAQIYDTKAKAISCGGYCSMIID
ncbi:unnamed protein product, partial [marine sediment metagenome]